MRVVVQISTSLHARNGLDVIVDLVRWQRRIGFGSDQANRWIIGPLLVFVFVAVDGSLLRVCVPTVLAFSSRHPVLTPALICLRQRNSSPRPKQLPARRQVK